MNPKLKNVLEWITALGGMALACLLLAVFVWLPFEYLLEHLGALIQAHYK